MSHGGFPQTDDPIWKEQYAELTERERVFYWEGLPRLLRAVHIGIVCHRSIPYIVDRLSKFESELWDHLLTLVYAEQSGAVDADVEDVQLYLRRFIGFYVIIKTLDNTEYSKIVSNTLVAMGVATHRRLLNWDISEIRSEVAGDLEQRRACRAD